jgi:hypothetical protein
MKISAYLCLLCGGWPGLASPAAAQPRDEQQAVTKGLVWLAKAQQKDGHWEGAAGSYPTAMTALAGMAFLAEGSTPLEGKYKEEVRRAVSWLTTHQRKNGLLCSTHESEDRRYMHSHGLALLFLANVYAGCAPDKREEKARLALRKELEAVLKDAVAFSVQAQNERGGWYYVSAADGGQGDELNQTALQLHALEAARAAGVLVPAAALDQARKYLDESIPVLERNSFDPKPLKMQPPAIAAALAAVTSGGDLKSPLIKKWLPHCPKDASGLKSLVDLEPYFHCHYAQVMVRLGDKGHAELFPESRDPLRWSDYRKTLWARALKLQAQDGSWSHELGPVYATANYLIALQVDRGR